MNDIMTSFDASSHDLNSFDVYGSSGLLDASPLFGVESNPLADLGLDGQTVSPADVSRNSSFVGSVPNSAALTNLTSPELDFSPYPDSAYETSPLFSTSNVDDVAAWFPLFPDAAAPAVPPMERNASQQSASSSNDSPLVMGASAELSPDPKVSPSGGHRRSTSSAGVNKSRRRAGPLKAITDYDAADKASMKRARNTMAARVSRARKVDHIDTLEKRVADLEAWKDKARATLVQHGYNGPLLQTE